MSSIWGFVQTVRLHWRGILDLGYLRSLVAIACYDALIASFAFLVLLPVLAILVSPWFLLGYVLDAPAVIVPVTSGSELDAYVSDDSLFPADPLPDLGPQVFDRRRWRSRRREPGGSSARVESDLRRSVNTVLPAR